MRYCLILTLLLAGCNAAYVSTATWDKAREMCQSNGGLQGASVIFHKGSETVVAICSNGVEARAKK
jgi:2-methylcitrate dehydratase PrpD